MNVLKQGIRGEFSGAMLPRYLLGMSLVFWGLVYFCWRLYPAENQFSIMTHFFSFLGSFDEKHNPQGWWLFSIALIFLGIAHIPLTIFFYRRFSVISKHGAALGALLFLLGSVGMILVAFFPESRRHFWDDLSFGVIHIRIAGFSAMVFGLGIFWHGLLLIKGWFFMTENTASHSFHYQRLVWPYAFWMLMFLLTAWHLIQRHFMYMVLRKAIAAGDAPSVHYFKAFSDSRFSLFLWENIIIYTWFIFLIWFSLALPRELPGPDTTSDGRTT